MFDLEKIHATAMKAGKLLSRLAKPLATFSTLAALVFAGLSFRQSGAQVQLARRQALADRIGDIGAAAASCAQESSDTTRQLSPAYVWKELCTARSLAYEVLVQDLIIAAADPRFLSAGAPTEISIHVEDALVRELVQVTWSFDRGARDTSLEDRCRMRGLVTATYMLAHSSGASAPGVTFSEEFEDQLSGHRQDVALAIDVDHSQRFLALAAKLEELAPAQQCKDLAVGSTLFGTAAQ